MPRWLPFRLGGRLLQLDENNIIVSILTQRLGSDDRHILPKRGWQINRGGAVLLLLLRDDRERDNSNLLWHVEEELVQSDGVFVVEQKDGVRGRGGRRL